METTVVTTTSPEPEPQASPAEIAAVVEATEARVQAEQAQEQAAAATEVALAAAAAAQAATQETAPSAPSLTSEDVAAIVRAELAAERERLAADQAEVVEATMVEVPPPAETTPDAAPAPAKQAHPLMRLFLGRWG